MPRDDREPHRVLFNSYTFWVFFAVVILFYRRLPHRGQNRMLLVASYFFYGSWDWRFLSLIWISTIVDYLVALRIPGAVTKARGKALMWVSVCVNLGILGTFKYYGFFAEEVVTLARTLGWELGLPSLHVVLPVGISFYTFQTMSYSIDVYRGKIEPVRSFWDFALYVCFFPQLVAGPIERSQQLMPQITRPRAKRADDFAEGLYLVVTGLFKKVVIADNLAVIVNAIFGTPTSELTGLECLAGVYAFAFQIYGDFSGYSSIARGVSRWLGIDLMVNFRMPYLAISPSDFWRRWHISLSTWLRDYLYVPLGGNRGGDFETYRNLMITMLLGGLWHGAGWTFIAWGFFHGLILGVYRPLEAGIRRLQKREVGAWWRLWCLRLVMLQLVCFGWLLFRAESMDQVALMCRLIVSDPTPTALSTYAFGMIGFLAGPLMLFEVWLERAGDVLQLTHVRWQLRAAVYCYAALMLLICQPTVQSEFIYFQF